MILTRLFTLLVTHLECDERPPTVPLARVLPVPRGADHVVRDLAGVIHGLRDDALSIGPESSIVKMNETTTT